MLKKYRWSDNAEAQIDYKNVAINPIKYAEKRAEKLEKLLQIEKEKTRKLREKNKKLSSMAKRENDKWYQIQRHKKVRALKQHEKVCKGLGFCFVCGNFDLDILQEHHVFGRNYDEFTITLCPNCHRRLHNFMGQTLGNTTKISRRKN